jgi:hypothetical protein
MADSITWRLNSDSSQVRAEMAQSMQSVSKGTTQMKRDLDGVTSTHEAILRSDHRVAGSLRMLTREATTAGSGFETLGAAFESFAMATNVSLPALIGLEIIGTLISKIVKAHEEAAKLDKELTAAGGPRDPKLTVDEDIRKRKEAIEKANKDIESKQQSRSTWHWYDPTSWHWSALMDTSGDPDRRGNRPGQSRPNMSANDTTDRSWGQMMAMRKDDLEIEKEKVAAAEKAAVAIKEQAEQEKKLADAAKGKLGALQYSLEDIAKEGAHKRDHPFRVMRSDDAYLGDMAEQAIAQQQEARRLRMLGPRYNAQALAHEQSADAIKAQISPLKDSEKDFLSAIERAAVYKEMLQELKRINFKNGG